MASWCDESVFLIDVPKSRRVLRRYASCTQNKERETTTRQEGNYYRGHGRVIVVQRERSGLHKITAQNVHKMCTKYAQKCFWIPTVAAAVAAAGDVGER